MFSHFTHGFHLISKMQVLILKKIAEMLVFTDFRHSPITGGVWGNVLLLVPTESPQPCSIVALS